MSHWLSNSDLEELYISDLFKRKQVVEYLEANLTGAHKKTSNTDI